MGRGRRFARVHSRPLPLCPLSIIRSFGGCLLWLDRSHLNWCAGDSFGPSNKEKMSLDRPVRAELRVCVREERATTTMKAMHGFRRGWQQTNTTRLFQRQDASRHGAKDSKRIKMRGRRANCVYFGCVRVCLPCGVRAFHDLLSLFPCLFPSCSLFVPFVFHTSPLPIHSPSLHSSTNSHSSPLETLPFLSPTIDMSHVKACKPQDVHEGPVFGSQPMSSSWKR